MVASSTSIMCQELNKCLQIKRKLVQHSDSLILILRVQVSDYVWQTYKEVYDTVTDIGSAMRSCGVKPVIYLIRF